MLTSRQKSKTVVNPKKVIGFDLDGVIIDHTKMRILLAKKRGFSLRSKDTASDTIRKALPLPHRRLIQYFIYSHPLIALEAPLMAGAKKGLEKIKKSKIPYFLISRRREPELAVKLLRLRGLWPGYFNPKNAFFVLEKEDKDILAKKFGVTHFIDDEIGVLEKLTSVKNKFLFDQHNASKKTLYQKVKDWPKLTQKILES